MSDPAWNDLPSELLQKVASMSGAAERAAMRAVSGTWRSGLESTATKLLVDGPTFPLSLPSRWPLLAALDLKGCYMEKYVRPQEFIEGLRALQSLSLLEKLAVRMYPENFTEDCILALRALSRCKLDVCVFILDWDSTPIDTYLEMLRGLPLEALEVAPFDERNTVSDAGLAALQGMPLTKLCINRERLTAIEGCTDAGLKVLRGMPLTDLDLSYSGTYTGVGIRELVGLLLTSLKLEDTRIEDDVLGLLQGMPLKQLNLNKTGVADAGLEQLRGMPLTHLDLGFTSITGSGFTALVGMPLLQLHLDECEHLDEWRESRFWEGKYRDCLQKLAAASGS